MLSTGNQNTFLKINPYLASLTELISRAFIEKTYLRDHSIPITTLIYLANDLFKVLDKKDEPQKMNLVEELKISYKQLMGNPLTNNEKIRYWTSFYTQLI